MFSAVCIDLSVAQQGVFLPNIPVRCGACLLSQPSLTFPGLFWYHRWADAPQDGFPYITWLPTRGVWCHMGFGPGAKREEWAYIPLPLYFQWQCDSSDITPVALGLARQVLHGSVANPGPLRLYYIDILLSFQPGSDSHFLFDKLYVASLFLFTCSFLSPQPKSILNFQTDAVPNETLNAPWLLSWIWFYFIFLKLLQKISFPNQLPSNNRKFIMMT